MLVHLRLTVPADLTGEVRDRLVREEWITNVVVHPGACLDPVGDLVECDVAREAASQLLDELSELGVGERGGVLVSTPSSTPFDGARRAERAAPGDAEDAVIWRALESDADDVSRPNVSFQIFLTLAVLLASIAVIEDSPILVVGAMVVGPEFSAIAAMCVGLVFANWALVGRSLRLLVSSFALAVGAVTLLALLARMAGVLTADMVTRPRPQTGFIWHPDPWSFVVALVAGTAGVLALATEQRAAMVGVFISVTTVPAAGNLALALALWETGEIAGSLAQLGLNVLGMLLAGTVFLAVRRAVQRRAR